MFSKLLNKKRTANPIELNHFDSITRSRSFPKSYDKVAIVPNSELSLLAAYQ